MIALLVVIACNAGGEPTAEDGDIAAFVKVTPARVGPMERTLEIAGTIEAGRSADLVPDIPGKVKRLPVQIGDEVKKGQLLAQIDVDMAALQQEQALSAVRLATLGLETAQREFERAQQLHQRGSLTDQQFDQARAGHDMAVEQLNQAKSASALAGEQVSGGQLLAPFAGVVSKVAVEEGEYYNPMTASPLTGGGLVGLVNVDTVRIDLQVADTDIGRLEKDMPAHLFVDAIDDLLPATGVTGRVETVGLAADAMARTFPVRVVAENPDRALRPGMHGRVRLVLERKEGVLTVPDEAVREAQGQAYVMVVEAGKARRVTVETGLDGDQGTEIVSGLEEGAPVVVEGNFGLPDGAPVEVASADGAADEE